MNKFVEELKGILSSVHRVDILGDTAYQFSLDQITELQLLQEQETVSRYIQKGIATQSLHECEAATKLKIVGDMLFNGQNGFGTMLDPEQYTRPIMPVMIGAGEASALYAGGGLPASIVDKKSTAMLLNGATFKSSAVKIDGKASEFWSLDKIQALEAAAEDTGFNDMASDAIRDAFLYGGSILYPVFNQQSGHSERISGLLRDINRSRLEKGSIRRWVECDRWNTVYVPSFDPTAEDYLRPKTVMVCQEAVEVSTSRVCLIKPKPMPYWSAICNMGWSPSDISGWISAYYAYEITQMSIPVMAQQMSLLLYRMPIDALNATVGVNQVEKLMQVNEEQMKSWSALSPKAVNMVGEVEVVDRTYSGFEQFVGAIKSDLAAQCEIPEPNLWHTPNKGFSDSTQESLLKQSETLQLRQHFIERYFTHARDALIIHVYGTDSPEWQNRHSLTLTFDKPALTTEKELSDVGAKFAAAINSFVQAGVSPDTALTLALPFYPSVQLNDEDIAAVKQSYKERMDSMQMAQSSVGGQGVSFKGGNSNEGKSKGQKPRKPNNA